MNQIARRVSLPHIITLAGLAVAASAGAQQPYPIKPIRIVVPFAPGGIADFAARSVSQKLSENLGVAVVVDNRPGAAGITGSDIVAKAAPDGYTVLITSISHTINLSVNKNLPFDTRRDFTAVMLIADAPNILVTHPSLPVNSVKELIALARAKPGQIAYASSGSGTSTHLSGELFKVLTKTDFIPRAIQRRRPGRHRSPRRSSAVDVRDHAYGAATNQSRQTTRAGSHRQPPFRRRTGISNDCRGRRSGL